jgi:hypothetical protein
MERSNLKHLAKLDIELLPLLDENAFDSYFDKFGYPTSTACNILAEASGHDRLDVYTSLKFIRQARQRATALTPSIYKD